MSAEAKLKELGLTLPPVRTPAAAYVAVKQVGNILYLSGQGPSIEGLEPMFGKLGREFDKEAGYQAARRAGLNLLAQAKAYLGGLDKVKQVVRVTCYVNSTDDFTAQPFVTNGCSDLMAEVFGKNGVHARSAVGVCALPSDIPVEIEMILEVHG